ncbi:DUF5672 family protein [Mucilaginibacter sp. L196]|uniref:DUF5672 family protein n=1 Tax=Mucilaginibacter sp. L196 TaxID=1641870 RepID=UPI00131C4FFE|nr:DUF5672 family protein [Mucilaginibacter sp. L196]
MISTDNLCVIIPVHTPELSEDDILSLQACYNQLKQYICFLVFPEGMNVDKYLGIHKKLSLVPVDPSWLSSVEDYNKMKIDISFYEIFRQYTFMLTYELDAYIFNSSFETITSSPFDYIGAPFFEGYTEASADADFKNGGNSGFSIRNIQSCIKVLHSMKKYYPHWQFYKYILSHFPKFRYHLNRITKGKYDILINGHVGFYYLKTHTNEDVFWSQMVPILFPAFKVANSIQALKFSFEINPEKLLELNNGHLPIGCHAWPKNKFFWKKYIDLN